MLGGRAAGGPGASASGTRGAWTEPWPRSRAGAASKIEDDAVRARGPKGEDLSSAAGQKIGPGVELWTDAKSRARVELEDGTVLALDRQTRVRIEDGPRTLRVAEGVVMADVAHIDGAPPARLVTATGEVEVLGTKLALTATADRTSVEVLRGAVELKDGSQKLMIGAGQEGIAAKNAKLEMAPVQGLAQRLAFGEKLGFAGHNEDTDLPVSGLGELRARKPGRQDEKDRAVRLAAHRVKVRIAGSVARTEIDETFTNDADEELEGIYRFPLPPGAQIEKLSLEVDGKLVDGAFVDKAKGAAIWRGVIQNAAPKAPKPKEEIFWVPGPWRDPALLEWKRGGRFELRIFPIPKRGSRRIVISYTENVAPTAGVRRFTYPLPQSTSSDLRIGAFDLDVQVLGADPKQPVRARGYEVRRAEGEAGGVERFTMSERDFVPTGDLTVEYALADRASDVNAWAYTSSGAPSAPQDSFAAFALRPKFASWGESKPRDVAIVVDSGRAMFGERFQRARRLAVQIAQELDRRDRVTVLACDIACKEAPGSLESAGGQKAKSVAEFLAGIEPDGATDLVGALRRAAARKDATRDLRVILVSDGIASAGFRTPRRIEAETRDVLGDARSSLVAVPIGADADTRLLEGVARAGGGVVVPYAPGQTLEGTAVDVVTASYGVALRDVELTLPEGLVDTAPRVLPSIRPGGELVVTAKMTRDSVRRRRAEGKVAGQPFEARYPLDVRATTNAGNAFVPRLFAAARISDMEDGARTDQERAEVVKLSQRFSVPSRLTSLLVLESEAMFNAFGIDRTQVAPTWTGETLADGTEVATLAKDEVGAGLGTLGTRSADAYDGESLGGLADKKESSAGAGQGSAAEGWGARASPRPRAHSRRRTRRRRRRPPRRALGPRAISILRSRWPARRRGTTPRRPSAAAGRPCHRRGVTHRPPARAERTIRDAPASAVKPS
ncbi:MAG: FecR domain-containing protein [Polyangiaceae bacterium]